MAHGNIEHVNITVTDPERSKTLFEDLLGWKERWRGPSLMGGRTIHVGDAHNYVAIYTNDAAKGGFAKGVPLNHVGLWVDDLPKAVEWMTAHGVRFAPGGIRKGASGYDICFIHPKASDEFPIGGEGVLIELVQAPAEVIAALG